MSLRQRPASPLLRSGMGRPGPGPAHAALSQSASADTSGAQNTENRECRVSRYRRISSPRLDLTRGDLYKNSEALATVLSPKWPRNGVSKLNRPDCFCHTESNKKAKSVFKIRSRSELQQNMALYVSPGPAPGYPHPVRGPLLPYTGFRPVQTPASASWSGYQVMCTLISHRVLISRVKPSSCPPPPECDPGRDRTKLV